MYASDKLHQHQVMLLGHSQFSFPYMLYEFKPRCELCTKAARPGAQYAYALLSEHIDRISLTNIFYLLSHVSQQCTVL
jgi:hypothetical protein